MSESAPLNDEEKIREGTETLQQLAEDVERERAERGRTEFDGAPEEPDERVMSDAAASSIDSHDVDNETREDHSPGARGAEGRAESGVDATLGVPGARDSMPH